MSRIPIQLNHITEAEWSKLLHFLDSEDKQEQQAYMAHYQQLPQPLQGELGYMTALLRAGLQGAVSPTLMAYLDRLSGADRLVQPIAFCGWAGEHHDIGPAYDIRRESFAVKAPHLFYSDEDIASCEEAARNLAECIRIESAGICDVQVCEMEMIAFPGDASETGWVICFHLEENDPDPVFVLPKAGEFVCCLGQVMTEEEPRSGYVLARHSYCMK